MCRLFGMHAAEAIRATFWLLDAPDSLAAQSRREPDGAGIGVFDEHGLPVVDKQPIAAWADDQFTSTARTARSRTFVAHVRYASTGGLSEINTHPFTQDGRIFAHNGAFTGLEVLEHRLSELDVGGLVLGQTDSERMFALITAEVRARSGDVRGGLLAAVRWIGENLPVYCLNLVLSTPDELWALRLPDTNDLHLLERAAGGHAGPAPLEARSARIHASSHDLARHRAIIVASEAMDDDPGWRTLDPGELVHVDPDGEVHRTVLPLTILHHRLTVADLPESAATSQQPMAHDPAPTTTELR